MKQNNTYEDEIFDIAYMDSEEERSELSRHRGGRMRLTTVKSGNMLEAEIYPVWDNSVQTEINAKRKKRTSEEERKYYEKRVKKRFARLINANFTDMDIWATLTYRDGELPNTIEEANHEIDKFIRRLSYYCKKHNLPGLKYAIVTESYDEDGKALRIHHHLFINFRDRDVLERIWGHDDRPHTRRLQADENGYDGAAYYTMKAIKKGKKSYKYSQNLKAPTIYRADSKITARMAVEMAKNHMYFEEKMRKMYREYEIVSTDIRTSSFVSGFYMYAKLRKRILQSNAISDAPDKPIALSKEQVKRLRQKLMRIPALKKEIASLETEEKCAKTLRAKSVRSRIKKAQTELSKLITYFNLITKKMEPGDRALLRDRFINCVKLEKLAMQYHYGDKSSIFRRIDKVLSIINIK